ncbi:MAG: glutamate synthase-related protein, partial [Actinomycetota bacterium]|nr:glutamate synthase-related protein [Actinomycetota bacterium]
MRVEIARFDELEPLEPSYALVEGVDLVIVRWADEEQVSVLYGRCLHRGALMADGRIEGENLFCGLHGWDYRYRTGVSEYHNEQVLQPFSTWIDDGRVFVEADEIASWRRDHPQPYDRLSYQGMYQDFSHAPDEPFVAEIRELAGHGLERTGAHGPMGAMGVPRSELPSWDQLQIVTAQLAAAPFLDAHEVGTELTIGPDAAKPLRLDIPIFVSDMSFGALSEEAKVALARGAELAGTGIASGEGGMLAAEQNANGRYL